MKAIIQNTPYITKKVNKDYVPSFALKAIHHFKIKHEIKPKLSKLDKLLIGHATVDGLMYKQEFQTIQKGCELKLISTVYWIFDDINEKTKYKEFHKKK